VFELEAVELNVAVPPGTFDPPVPAAPPAPKKR
jgi:hypothetical protein